MLLQSNTNDVCHVLFYTTVLKGMNRKQSSDGVRRISKANLPFPVQK
jgi:hypothetical protein